MIAFACDAILQARKREIETQRSQKRQLYSNGVRLTPVFLIERHTHIDIRT